MRLRIVHTTHYRYSEAVTESHNEVRLMPITDDHQTCLQFHLTTDPSARIFSYSLPTGFVHYFNVRAAHGELKIVTEAQVVTYSRAVTLDDLKQPNWRDFYARQELRERYCEYLSPTLRVPLLPEVDEFADKAAALAEDGAGSFLTSLLRVLNEDLNYVPGATNVDSSIATLLAERSGVCQDFTHLMLAICRRQGIPARYVSGYLYTGRPEDRLDELPPDGGLVSGDATHAWVECLLPDNNWYGLDPTNDVVAGEGHVKGHHGQDYDEIAPLRGLYAGLAGQLLDVSVRVTADSR